MYGSQQKWLQLLECTMPCLNGGLNQLGRLIDFSLGGML